MSDTSELGVLYTEHSDLTAMTPVASLWSYETCARGADRRAVVRNAVCAHHPLSGAPAHPALDRRVAVGHGAPRRRFLRSGAHDQRVPSLRRLAANGLLSAARQQHRSRKDSAPGSAERVVPARAGRIGDGTRMSTTQGSAAAIAIAWRGSYTITSTPPGQAQHDGDAEMLSHRRGAEARGDIAPVALVEVPKRPPNQT